MSAAITRCDGVLLKRSLYGSLEWLRLNRERVNQLNVFPVPDGDTGTNMLLTLESAVEELAAADEHDISRVAQQVAHGALMGARGNSGVILSQVLRGFAQGVKDFVSVDTRQMAHAFEEATTVAYKGVTKPTEGTILTVARAISTEALKRAEETDDIAQLIHHVVGAAQRAVDETPSQLAVLREAGVVDAGGYGLMVILEGFLKTMRPAGVITETDRPAMAEPTPMAAPVLSGAHALEAPEEGWGFCTEFLIAAPTKPFEAVRSELTPMGNSAVIVGDDDLVRVHIHTFDPGALIAHAASSYGTLQKLKVEDMTRQHREILADTDATGAEAAIADPLLNGAANGHPPLARIGVVAVAAGDGFRRIFEELGAVVVEGGQTMNPSTEDLLQAVRANPAASVIILPNNKNVIMSAQQVLQVSDKQVAVVPTRTVPQGITALLSLNPEADLDGNTDAMRLAVKAVQTVEVTHAVRTTSLNGVKIKSGDVIALVDGKITHAGTETGDVIDRALEAIDAAGFELLTVYAGADATPEDVEALVEHLAQRFPKLAVETQRGEQSHYPYILSLE
ncbi:MAG: DAK2 domain-containing protein [Candidatus Dormibacteria bacterium]